MNKIYFFDPICNLTYEDIVSRPIGGSEFQFYNLIKELSKVFNCFVFNHATQENVIGNIVYMNMAKIFESEFADENVTIICQRRPEPKLREIYKNNKIILWVHDLSDFLSKYRDYIAADKNLHLVCNSNFTRDFVIPKEVGNIHSKRLSVIYNIFYPSFFNKMTSNVDSYQLIYASALCKGIQKIIKIFDFILTRNKNFKLVLLNPGYDWDRWDEYREDLIRKYGESIKIMGPQTKEIYSKFLRESLLVFAPDFMETFGCVFAEASYMGTPTIASLNSGAVREIIGDEYLADYNNPEEVYRLVEKVYNNRPLVTLDNKFMPSPNLEKWVELIKLTNEFSIGYLSWKKPELLESTLESHLNNGLFNLIPADNRIVFFQEISKADIKLAEKYNCQYLGNDQNIGILNAFINLVEKCNTKYFIFCENDFTLLNNSNTMNIKKCLEDVSEILNEYLNAQIKLSNTKTPGFLYCTPKDSKEWLKNDNANYPYKIESLSWIDEPEGVYPQIKSIHKNYKWYKVEAKDQIWSNHIHVCNTKFLKETVLPILKHSRDFNKDIDLVYQGLEDTLNRTEDIPKRAEEVNKCIEIFKKRLVFSGGGNFFHNKK